MGGEGVRKGREKKERKETHTQPSNRIPAPRSLKPSTTALIPAPHDIVKHLGICIHGRVQEAKWCFSVVETLFVDARDEGCEEGRAGRGAVQECEVPLGEDGEGAAGGGDVWIAGACVRYYGEIDGGREGMNGLWEAYPRPRRL